MPTYLHWHTRALNEGLGDPDRARLLLLDQDPEDLASQEMMERIVGITGQAVSSSATDKIRRSQELLDAIAGGPGCPDRR